TWPTVTPATSVIASSGPGVPSNGTPRSRARGLGDWAASDDATRSKIARSGRIGRARSTATFVLSTLGSYILGTMATRKFRMVSDPTKYLAHVGACEGHVRPKDALEPTASCPHVRGWCPQCARSADAPTNGWRTPGCGKHVAKPRTLARHVITVAEARCERSATPRKARHLAGSIREQVRRASDLHWQGRTGRAERVDGRSRQDRQRARRPRLATRPRG